MTRRRIAAQWVTVDGERRFAGYAWTDVRGPISQEVKPFHIDGYCDCCGAEVTDDCCDLCGYGR